MEKMTSPNISRVLSHVARLAHYHEAGNDGRDGRAGDGRAALDKVAELMPASYRSYIEKLKALADDHEQAPGNNSKRDFALLYRLKHLARSHGGSRYGVVVAYFAQLSHTEFLAKSFWAGLRSIFTYCLAILVISVVVMGIVTTKVLPEFEAMFSAFHAELPAFTLFALAIAEHALPIFMVVAVISSALFALVLSIKRRVLTLTPLWPSLDKIPMLSGLAITYRHFLYLQYMKILVHAGIDTNAPGVNEELWAMAYGSKQDLQEHQSIHVLQSALIAAQRLGALPQELSHQRAVIVEELVEQLVITRSAIWAVLMSLLGLVVGGMVIAVYLPIFALGSTI